MVLIALVRRGFFVGVQGKADDQRPVIGADVRTDAPLQHAPAHTMQDMVDRQSKYARERTTAKPGWPRQSCGRAVLQIGAAAEASIGLGPRRCVEISSYERLRVAIDLASDVRELLITPAGRLG